MADKAVEKREKQVEYVPFGAEDKIQLSINMVKNFVSNPTKSGALPGDRDVMNFIMMCKSKKLNPFEGDAYLIGYDSKDGPTYSLITAHQAFLKRAETHNEFDGMESGVFVKDTKGEFVERHGDYLYPGDALLAGWARVYFKSRKIPMFRRVDLSTFNTGRSRWAKDPAGMIVKCAEADALRSSFPTLTAGLYNREEMDKEMYETNNNAVTTSAYANADDLNEKLIQARSSDDKVPQDESVPKTEGEDKVEVKDNVPPEPKKEEPRTPKANSDEKDRLINADEMEGLKVKAEKYGKNLAMTLTRLNLPPLVDLQLSQVNLVETELMSS